MTSEIKWPVTINVDSTTDFAAGFVSGEKIQGLTSGAFGCFRSKSSTTVVIDRQYGHSKVGKSFTMR